MILASVLLINWGAFYWIAGYSEAASVGLSIFFTGVGIIVSDIYQNGVK